MLCCFANLKLKIEEKQGKDHEEAHVKAQTEPAEVPEAREEDVLLQSSSCPCLHVDMGPNQTP